LVLSAWFGRARGLIPIGLLLVLVAIPATVIDVPISGGIGDRHYRPTTRAEIRRNYELGIGQINLDLTDAPVANRYTTISASVGVGDISVNVPANVLVVVTAHTGAGMTDVFGHENDGWPRDTYQVGGANQSGQLTLDLEVGAGSIHVRRFAANGALLAG
jgi:predicted membrane protein